MAPVRAAVVQFINSKSCFVNVPATWRYNRQLDKILTFEVCHGEKVSYFSWSGKFSHKPRNADDDVIEVDHLYAQRLSLDRGQQVLVKEVAFVPSCSQFSVEPVGADDWEALEANSERLRSQLLNQVRIVFLDQVLPVWIGEGLPVLLHVTQLSCSSRVAQINPSTELHVTPKFQDSGIGLGSESGSSSIASPSVTSPSLEASPATSLDNHTTPSTPSSANSMPAAQKSGSLFNHIWRYLSGVDQSPDLTPVNKTDNETNKTPNYWNNDTRWRTTLRVTYLATDLDECCDKHNDVLHQLLHQSTTAFVSTDSLPLVLSNHNSKQSHKALLVRMKKIPSPEEKLDEATKTSKTLRDNERSSGAKENACFVKLIPIESMTNKDCSCMVAIRRATSFPGHVVVPNVLCASLRLEIGSRVIAEADRFCVKNVSQVVVQRSETQSADQQNSCSPELFKNLLNELTDVTCPLVLNPKTPLSLGICGNQEIIWVSPGRNRKEANETNNVAYQLLPLRAGADVTCIFRDGLLLPLLDVPRTNLEKDRLGAVDDLMSQGFAFMKFQLGLSSLAKSLSLPISLKCMAIVGVRGSGKSAVAQALCRKVAAFPYYVHTEILHCKQLKGKRAETIQKMWKKVLAQAVHKAPSVVVFDDLDHLCGASASAERNPLDSLQEQIATMLVYFLKYELSHGKPVVVLATCCSKEALHPFLISTRGCHVFTQFLTIQPLNMDQREKVLKSLLLQRNHLDVECIKSCNLTEIAKRTEGAVAQDLKLLVDKAVYSALSDSKTDGEILLDDGDFEHALNGFTPSNLRDIAKNLSTLSKGWDDVGGLHDVKKTLEETFFWPTKYPELFAQCTLRLSTGLLLYGPPGTGKTMMAGALAKECALNFISIKGPELLSKYIGASEQAVRDLFCKAQAAQPCILFFDEFDAIAPRRGHDSTGVTDRVVNQLLTQMDGVEERTGVYVLAATSRPDLIDPALLRPGRLDKCLHCPLPEREEQLEIVRVLSRTLNIDPEVDWTVASDTWDNLSGADLQAFLFDAQLMAIREESSERTSALDPVSTNDDLNGALKWFCMPSLEEGVVDELHPEKKKSIDKQVETILEVQGCRSVTCPSSVKPKPTCCVTVHQRHLIQAAQHLKPSVSPSERLRYKKIYETFVQSRGGDFTTLDRSGVKRATFA